MRKKLHIKKNDNVIVITGKSKGQKGKVLEVITSEEKAIVEGVNIIKKHTKPNAASPQGGIVSKEAPIHISNLMLINPATGKPTKIGRKINEEGKLVRYSKKTGEEIK